MFRASVARRKKCHRQIKVTVMVVVVVLWLHITCARINADIFILMKMAKHIWCQDLASIHSHTHTHAHTLHIFYCLHCARQVKMNERASQPMIRLPKRGSKNRNEYGKMIMLLLFVWKMIASLNWSRREWVEMCTIEKCIRKWKKSEIDLFRSNELKQQRECSKGKNDVVVLRSFFPSDCVSFCFNAPTRCRQKRMHKHTRRIECNEDIFHFDSCC